MCIENRHEIDIARLDLRFYLWNNPVIICQIMVSRNHIRNPCARGDLNCLLLWRIGWVYKHGVFRRLICDQVGIVIALSCPC